MTRPAEVKPMVLSVKAIAFAHDCPRPNRQWAFPLGETVND